MIEFGCWASYVTMDNILRVATNLVYDGDIQWTVTRACLKMIGILIQFLMIGMVVFMDSVVHDEAALAQHTQHYIGR